MACVLIISIVAIVVTVTVSSTYGFNPDLISCCSCVTMNPERVANLEPQSLPSPFKIEIPKGIIYYSPGVPGIGINVNITTVDPSKSFHKFMIQARRTNISGSETRSMLTPIGTFVALDSNVKGVSICQRTFGADLTSTDNLPKQNIRLEWKPPVDFQGHIEFRASFIVDEKTYWISERSLPIYDKNDRMPSYKNTPQFTHRYIKPPIAPIDVTLCGQEKGCYRIPESCSEIECLYLVTWKHLLDTAMIEFEMSAITDGFNDRYFALALSEDIYCGRDLVFECVHNISLNDVRVYQSVNADSNNVNHRITDPSSHIIMPEGSYNQGRLRCRFKRHLDTSGDAELESFELSVKRYHLMMGMGIVGKHGMKYHGVKIGELPVTSPNEIDLLGVDDISGRARYHLVKAHACLMLLAWIFFAPTGLLWMKYYTTMWPNSRMFGERYWFVAHFNCTFWVVLLVFVGFILVLVEGKGWSNIPDLPSKAHPILGIISVVCVVICVPIIALIRCPEGHTCRPLGNWFYFLAWTIAFCLAVVNIFIGMDFGKAMVPWWLTWIICLFFLFNFICEVILEVHQCCTHKKNKERRKKWELQKKENPNVHIPEPWPAGRVFKRNVLFTHFIVSLIVVIIAVLTVAIAN